MGNLDNFLVVFAYIYTFAILFSGVSTQSSSESNIIKNELPEGNPPVAEVFLTKGNSEETVALSNDTISEIVITEDMVVNGSQYNHIVLLCNASYAIEWIYEGDGAPRLYTTQIRSFGDFSNPDTYGHSNIVVLFQERFNEQQTGTYICQGIENPELRVGYHLYFTGEFGFASVSTRVVQPKEKDAFVTLPCGATDPTAPMGLYKIEPMEEAANLTVNELVSYDPTTGFTFKLDDFPHPYGSYFCKAKDIESFWKIDLVPPKNQEVKVSPNSDVVIMNNFSNQTFMCKSKEKILLTMPNTFEFGSIEYFHNQSDSFPYLAILKISSNVPLYSISNYFKIHCIARRDRRILHTWEYSSFGPEELTVQYDKQQKRLMCCSKSGLTPIHEVAKCDTMTDCNIKKSCFQTGRCDYHYAPKFVDAPRGCTAVEFVMDFPSHIMKCSVGQKSKLVPITSTVMNDDIIIFDGAVPETEKILKITALSQKKNNEVHIRCIGNIFFFSTNLIFAFEKKDGSMRFADESSVENSSTYGPILHTVIDSDTKRVFCFAPLTRSSEWRNVSLPIVTVDDPPTPKAAASSQHRVTTRRRPSARKHQN